MFRQMRRFKQLLEREECEKILNEEWRGVLSVLGDDGYPYGIPLDFYYDAQAQRLYFHGAGEGHKVDAIKRCDKVSFCVIDKGAPEPGDWWKHFHSVVIFGRMAVIEDRERAREAALKLARKYFPDEQTVQDDMAKDFGRVTMFELKIEHMTGKHVKER